MVNRAGKCAAKLYIPIFLPRLGAAAGSESAELELRVDEDRDLDTVQID